MQQQNDEPRRATGVSVVLPGLFLLRSQPRAALRLPGLMATGPPGLLGTKAVQSRLPARTLIWTNLAILQRTQCLAGYADTCQHHDGMGNRQMLNRVGKNVSGLRPHGQGTRSNVPFAVPMVRSAAVRTQIAAASSSAYRLRMPNEKWPQKHGENVADGSLTPTSVPATFAVYSLMK